MSSDIVRKECKEKLKIELGRFIEFINLKKGWNINKVDYLEDFNSLKVRRCMARIWDAGHDSSKNFDINRQCTNRVFLNDICRRCFKKKYVERVDEYPDEKITLVYYRNKINEYREQGIPKFKGRYVDDEINLNNYKKYIEKKDSKKKIHKKFSNKEIKEKKQMLNTVSEKNQLREESVTSLKVQEKIEEKEESINDWWNSLMLDKVEIYDSKNYSKFTFAMDNNTNNLLNKKGIILGKFSEWIDTSNSIPECYKNNENMVLNPDTAIPLFEFIVFDKMGLYHDLSPGTYREYRYDSNLEELCNTCSIDLS